MADEDDPALLAEKVLPDGRIVRLRAQIFNWHMTISPPRPLGDFVWDDDW